MSSLRNRSQRRSDDKRSTLASVRALPGVGARRETILGELGVSAVGDLLLYPPRTYIDRQAFAPIAHLTNDLIQSVAATVRRAEVKPAGGRRLFVLHVEDGSGRMRCVWFNQPYLRNVFAPGRTYVFSGRVRIDRFGTQMIHPEYEEAGEELVHTGRIVPVYRIGPGISQKQMRILVKSALEGWLDDVLDPLPESTRSKIGLVRLNEAMADLHFPPDMERAERARRRLAFDEVLVFQTLFALERLKRGDPSGEQAGRAPSPDRFTEALPFDLTRSQEEALKSIVSDIAAVLPMRRLLQGDVGCGKTVVAGIAAAMVCGRGAQVALMCPTEILAEQHFATVSTLLSPHGFRSALLSGSLPETEKAETVRRMEQGSVEMVVGTHALIGHQAAFDKLGLIIIDEEQRFGVLQRAHLLREAPRADLLVISATPIPRTLALTAYGDLDVTVIDQMPPGRGAHFSTVVDRSGRRAVLEEVAERVAGGEQGYYVCPAVEEGDAGLVDAGTVRGEMAGMLAGRRRVEVLTGRTPKDARRTIIDAFRRGRIGLLVATTVVEVGMDVPSATVLVVDQAERFGLSQLHQMRGRVARSSSESRSYFIMSDGASERARERVAVLEKAFDGFVVAEQDLLLRGPGDPVGTRQHGAAGLKYAQLPRDLDLVTAARDEAFRRVLEGDTSAEWQVWLAAVDRLAEGSRVAI
jgi:ATP-dependent DNA helicase RecG